MVDGKLYTTSTTVVLNSKTLTGCDSVEVYNITISNPLYSSESLFGCGSIVYKSATYTASSQVIDTLVSVEGCDSIHTANLFITQPIIQKRKFTTCPGEEYVLASGELISDSGVYSSTLTSVTGCDSIIIEEIGYYDIKESSVPDIEKCLGDEVTFDIGIWGSYEHIQWSTGEENTNILLDNFGLYAVNLIDENSCIVRDTFRVIDAQCPPCPVYIPNAFTPNRSGANESFKPVHECTFSEYKFQIYNRWGERIFETFNPGESWDGAYLGKDNQQDVYVWVLFYVDKKTKKSISQRGTVTLLR
jgi:gliding motility-associated-like protein